MRHFDEIKQLAITCVENIASSSSRYYIVRDVVGRISVYIVGKQNSTKDLQSNLENHIGKNWINRVTQLSQDNILYEEVTKEAIQISENIFYVERPLVKRTWNCNNSLKEEDKGKVITFYSYKGGVGRTTTLALTALQLVREGKKVVTIDFDLEAPGLSTLLKPELDYPKYGVVDYLIEQDNSNGEIDINDYVYPVSNKKLIGLSGGELIVMQAASLENRNVDDYYNKLSRIDFNMPKYMESDNAIQALIQQIQSTFEPDFIFIDSRAGIHDIGGITLFRCSDEVVPVFYGNEQNMLGLKFVLPKLIKLDIPFYLVKSPMPVSEEEAETELNYFLKECLDILVNEDYFTDVPDIFDESSPHYPINIRYDVLNTNIGNDEKLQQILNMNGDDNAYMILAKKLVANVDEKDNCVSETIKNRREILESIKNIMPAQTAAAETEFENEEDFVKKFYPLKEYRYIFDNSKFLITGGKGSGKTALFNVLKCPEYAHKLARYVDIRTDSIEKTDWVVGFDADGNFPTKNNFQRVGKSESQEVYATYWMILAVRVLKKYICEAQTQYPEIFNKIFSSSNSDLRGIVEENANINEQIEDYLYSLNSELKENNKIVIITYDALDSGIEKGFRGRFISELITFWAENNIRLSNIKAKIFLRNDIYKNEVNDVTDKIKLNNYRSFIDWDYDHLLAMIWKRMLEENSELKELIRSSLDKKGYALTESDDLGIIPRPQGEFNKIILEEIIGNKMGKGNKAYTYNWISYRLSDTNDKIVPRSILKLFSLAASHELNDNKIDENKLIKPKSLESSVTMVSEDRVTDMREEYPEYRDVFDKLKNYCEVFPVEENRLIEALIACGISKDVVKNVIDNLKEIGILKDYQRRKSDPIRYHIPDIYLKGMGLTRKGYH